jgi:hypothetical protein
MKYNSTVDIELLIECVCRFGGLGHLLHHGAGVAVPRCVGEHRHPRLNPKGTVHLKLLQIYSLCIISLKSARCGLRRREGDLRQLVRVRVNNDAAVRVAEGALLLGQHKKEGGDELHALLRPDNLFLHQQLMKSFKKLDLRRLAL